MIEALLLDAPPETARRVTLEKEALAESLIPDSDVVVMLEYSSSPILAAWEAGVPVVSWVADGLFYGPDDMFRDEWFPRVTDGSQLRGIVDRFRHDIEYRRAWVRKGHDLAGAFSAAPELADDELAALLEDVCRRRPRPDLVGRTA